jgi:RNA polymerase sigma-70 factor (ECF subfamily)
MNDNDYLPRIKNNDTKVIGELYKLYRDDFVRFIKSRFFTLDSERIEDAYAEAFHALYRNVQNGKLVKLTGTLKTYLFQIGLYKAIDEINRKKKLRGEELIDYKPTEEMLQLDYFEEDDEEIIKIRELNETVGQMKEPCSTLLRLFWFERKRDSEILPLTSFASVDVVKVKRSRCMKKLKEDYLQKLVRLNIISEEKQLQLLA